MIDAPRRLQPRDFKKSIDKAERIFGIILAPKFISSDHGYPVNIRQASGF